MQSTQKINGEGICIILMYVDDNLIVGSKKAIDKATKEIKEIFNVTISPIATEYLCCEINVAENYSCGWIGQSDLYKNLEKQIRQYVKRTTSDRNTKHTGLSCSTQYS